MKGRAISNHNIPILVSSHQREREDGKQVISIMAQVYFVLYLVSVIVFGRLYFERMLNKRSAYSTVSVFIIGILRG